MTRSELLGWMAIVAVEHLVVGAILWLIVPSPWIWGIWALQSWLAYKALSGLWTRYRLVGRERTPKVE